MFSKSKMPYLLTLATAVTMTACQPTEPLAKKEQTESAKEAQKPSIIASTTASSDADTSKISEALGNFIGRNLKSPGIQFDVESLVKGLRDGAAGKPSPMSDEEYEKAMGELQLKAFNALAETNLEAADKFLNDNAKAEGVIEITPGKLQYKVLQEGKGDAVPEHGTPLINYTGKFIDGSVFGTSENSDGPISISIDNTIPGFSKGLAGMKEGEKRRLFVHPDVGYGKGGQLPPNSLLIFDIEIVKAVSPDQEGLGDDLGELDDSIENESEEPKKAEEPKKK
jgi:peptidylprolyl isomerase